MEKANSSIIVVAVVVCMAIAGVATFTGMASVTKAWSFAQQPAAIAKLTTNTQENPIVYSGQSCVDSDGGNKPNTRGVCLEKGRTVFKDYCANQNGKSVLTEYVCSFNRCTRVSPQICSYGCNDDKTACLQTKYRPI